MVKGKSIQGRKKIEMKRIESDESRQVCFSKRRPSLFKKASELSTMCSAEVAVVTFSPVGGKCFSFGHPSTCSVVDRFLGVHTLHGDTMGSGSHGSQGLTGRVHELNQQLLELEQSLEDEKQRKQRAIEAMKRETGGRVMQRLSALTSALEMDELEEMRKELSIVQIMVKNKAREMLQDAMQTRELHPQSEMHMLLPSQVFSGGQTTGTRITFPYLSNGPGEVRDANSLLRGSIGGIGNGQSER
ncbi:hypothetical protein BS78_07G091900 [Paspalum vaginatum]|nr:hypothetical protein BS78_07G091900 [Paspalum vaginatum]